MSGRQLIVTFALLVFAAVGNGCGNLPEGPATRTPRTVAGSVVIGPHWSEIVPEGPLEATAKLHFLGLRIANVSGWADERREMIRFADGVEARIEVELVEPDGKRTLLYPNGFSDLVRFGKRASVRTDPNEAEFRIGSRFVKIRLRSDKAVTVQEVVWMEFDS